MKKLGFLGIALMATLLSVGIASCGKSNDEPTNNVSPTPKPAQTDTTVKVESVSISSATFSLNEGESQTLTVTISPTNATNKKYSFSSSNKDVASVDENGKVTALKAGEATITVTTADGNKTATCKVTVTPKGIPIESVSLDKAELILSVGQSETLTVTISPDNATNKELTWNSSDPTIATVDENGKVTAIKEGETTITVTTTEGKTSTCKINISPIVKRITEIKYDESSAYLNIIYTIEYDSDNRVVKFTTKKHSWNNLYKKYTDSQTVTSYTYTPTSIKIGNNTELILTDGLIREGCEYDENRQLISYKDGDKKITWDWVNGNPQINPKPKSSIEFSDIEMIPNLIIPGDYSFFWSGSLAMAGYYGKLPKNLPEQMKYTWYLSDGSAVHKTCSFSWIFKEGYLYKVDVNVKEESQVSNYNHSTTHTYTFKWE